MKESKCFNCKEKNYTTYNGPNKEKIAAISEAVGEDSNSQRKE